MSAKNRSLALLALLAHFLLINLVVSIVPFPGIAQGFRSLAMVFSAVLIVDILVLTDGLWRREL